MRIFLKVCGAFALVGVSFFTTLFLMNYFSPLCPRGEITEFKAPFGKVLDGFAYAAAAPSLERFADSNDAPTRSRFLVCEDNHPLGPPHTLHTAVAANGKGSYSHFGGNFIFSASDNSDPNNNGRHYWAVSGGK
jgi:hypothetical protein